MMICAMTLLQSNSLPHPRLHGGQGTIQEKSKQRSVYLVDQPIRSPWVPSTKQRTYTFLSDSYLCVGGGQVRQLLKRILPDHSPTVRHGLLFRSHSTLSIDEQLQAPLLTTPISLVHVHLVGFELH